MKNKKIILIALLVFAIFGVAGYGVYSYYWTVGEFGYNYIDNEYPGDSSGDNFIVLNGKFAPEFDDYVSLECTETNSSDSYSCSGTFTIRNEGSTRILVEVIDDDDTGTDSLDNVSVGEVSFNWTSTYIYPNESAELSYTYTATIDDDATNSDAVYVVNPVDSSYSETYLHLHLSANND